MHTSLRIVAPIVVICSVVLVGCSTSGRGSEIADCIRSNVSDASVNVVSAKDDIGDDADPQVQQAVDDGDFVEVVSVADAEDTGGFAIYVMSSPSAASDLADAGTTDVAGSAEGDVIISNADGWDEYYDGCI